MKSTKIKLLLLLHALLMVFSLSGVCGKMASSQPFLSAKFILWYGLLFALLGIYAIGWQQIIKRMPLTTAFSNKAVTVVWGIVYGALFFHEKITAGKLFGVVLIVIGVILFSNADTEESHGR